MIPQGLLPPRSPATHKGDAGRVFLLAGSVGFSGAAALATLGALRTGAGLVTLGIPKGLHDPMVKKLTEAMLKVLPETEQGSISRAALPDVLKAITAADAVAIGPGLSQQLETQALVQELLPQVAKPLVVDADGLNAIAAKSEVLRQRRQPMILTPHPGEMERLTGLNTVAIQQDRQQVAKGFAAAHQVVLVLKGHETVVANPDGQLYVNDTGNPGMATGGCGDVLTGMIAALLGQRLPLFDAARLGVYLHGLAGDLVAKERGEIGLLASDLADRIPLAIRQYQSLPV